MANLKCIYSILIPTISASCHICPTMPLHPTTAFLANRPSRQEDPNLEIDPPFLWANQIQVEADHCFDPQTDPLLEHSQMSKHKEKSWYSKVLKSFASFLCTSSEGEYVNPSKAKGPEAAMVSAAKHFSSVHKVRLD
ncbi:Uncharacterized protein Fot_15824 [Forsythia ovata]|uniref:Uncharacterized protein n=1 Tax=Forsythia ovata TaxID=205694 RepID=A0ABD1WAK4_9LAMI